MVPKISAIRVGSTRGAWTLIGSLLAVLLSPLFAESQTRGRAVPVDEYYQAYRIYYDGDYVAAAKAFRMALSTGVRSVDGRWVDSVCYFTMLGECQYHMGDLAGALEQYTEALDLALRHDGWMLRVEFPATLGPSQRTVARPPTWGVSNRNTQLAQIPDRMPSRQGRTDNDQVLRQGGVIAQPFLQTMDVREISRCTALALHRRRQLLGKTGQRDRLSSQLASALARRPTVPNHWSQAWISVQLGIVQATIGKTDEAIAELRKALVVNGQLDHDLTPLALLELAQLAFQQRQWDAAESYCLEATYSGAAFSQFDVMQEAFLLGNTIHIATGKKNIYPPLQPAALWASRGSRSLEAAIYLAAAEGAATAGDNGQATTLLEQSRRSLRRRDVSAGILGAQTEYLHAQLQFQTGRLDTGLESLAKVLAFQRKGSPWLLQIALADMAATSGAVTQRGATQLFEQVLREPTADDWLLDPMEAISALTVPHPAPLEHWFELLLANKETDKALYVSDQIRRHRFFSTMPLGGRILALRWILNAPPEMLDQAAQLQRQDLLVRYPAYAEQVRLVGELRTELALLPAVPTTEDESTQLAKLLADLAQVSTQQEAILHSLALRREPAELVFPPRRDVEIVQKGLQERQAILSFLTARSGLYGFLITKQKTTVWRVEQPGKVRSELTKMLRGIGNHDRNQPVAGDDLAAEEWREPGANILAQLTGNAKPEAWLAFDELIVVPDGELWYVPFEALPFPGSDKKEVLIQRLRIRYAPTIALAIPDDRPAKPLAGTLVVAGKLYPRDTPETAIAASDKLHAKVPGAVRLSGPPPAPSALYGVLLDRLVVWDDLPDVIAKPYDLSPIPQERGKSDGGLSAWLALPWGGPDQILLPGFHTSAEDSLKRGGNGNELFLTSMALMAQGTRSILLSRWRTGGEVSYDLMQEFVQELPHLSAAAAWQRSVQLAMDREIDLPNEPRVKSLPPGGLKASAPFFWSGYVLIDQGAPPPAVEAAAAGQ